MTTKQILTTYLHVRDGGSIGALPVSESFTQVPTTMLFLTPGAGTEHRPVNAA